MGFIVYLELWDILRDRKDFEKRVIWFFFIGEEVRFGRWRGFRVVVIKFENYEILVSGLSG